MSCWWRVSRANLDFLVLVVNNRVAVSSKAHWFFKVGDRWDSARRALEDEQFVCVMEAS